MIYLPPLALFRSLFIPPLFDTIMRRLLLP
jgi:hypothetical protein